MKRRPVSIRRRRCWGSIPKRGCVPRRLLAGGLESDLLVVPQAFSDHRPYALCAFAGGWADVALRQIHTSEWMPLVACVAITAGLRGLAVWRNWQLPAWRV